MKVAITGKGGVGKTTLSSTLARLYADEGRTVLAADVDPDANLGLALGLTEEEVNSITPISKMRQLVEERTGATSNPSKSPANSVSATAARSNGSDSVDSASAAATGAGCSSPSTTLGCGSRSGCTGSGAACA